ncbi:FAD-dependent monooxygenase [Streptomyces sp. NBC_00659]|uniref:FAD-dependent monooxygenase n=1 Tax=Streptomyces sp. NBC_00659 TaxID=2903669 RepID=UPI002E318E4B|nr:FAD-dependent monooxygenase [Streptomyces sp. NBC_00659]
MHAQVVIVGGGPVGMLVAAELGAYGVRTLVLEERAGISGRPRASTLHARALQCLVRRGYLPELVPGAGGAGGVGVEATAPFHFAGLSGLAITAPAAEPGPILKRPQAELERVFEQRARSVGARVLRGYRVAGVAQDQGGVQVVAEGPSGVVLCTAEYLVGADGARSTVREQGGVACAVYPATVSALAGLVRLSDPDALPPGWHQTPRGWIVARNDPGQGTHIRTLNCAGEDPRRHLPLTLEELRQEVSRIAGRGIAMEDPRWLSRFSDFSRLARTYRSGRILLAGDAAHVHFPIGGQGLSTGVQDALDLGWKLAFTVRGLAGEGLLDTYDQERRPAARRVIDNTRAQLSLMRPDPGLDALRSLFNTLLGPGQEGGRLGDMISAQDTVLPRHTRCPSAWEGRFLQNVGLASREGPTDVIELLRAGEGRFLLLLFGECGSRYLREAQAWADGLCPVWAEPTPAVPFDALLVRPDGYVAWAPGGGSLDAALALYLRGIPAARREPVMPGVQALG